MCSCSGVGEPGNEATHRDLQYSYFPLLQWKAGSWKRACMAKVYFIVPLAQIFSLLLQLFRLEAATPTMPPWDIQ